jgi:hypothetical protein
MLGSVGAEIFTMDGIVPVRAVAFGGGGGSIRFSPFPISAAGDIGDT